MRIVLQITPNMIGDLSRVLEIILGSGGLVGAYVTIHKLMKKKNDKTMRDMQRQIEDLKVERNAWELRHNHLTNKLKKHHLH